jgi:DNA invertase Pin-like site-specific DNA recombinase
VVNISIALYSDRAIDKGLLCCLPSLFGAAFPYIKYKEVLNMNFSYKRVSTIEQDLRRQEEAFGNIKIDKEYSDKLTGKHIDRPALNRLRLDAQQGDNIYIESISRLGRNVDDLRQLVQEFKEKGVTVHFIKEGFNTGEGNNMFKFMLTILGAVAEMERELTVERVREGIRKAQKYGTKSGRPIGRPARQIPASFKKYYTRWKANQLTAVEFAKLIEVSKPTLYTYIRHHEEVIV